MNKFLSKFVATALLSAVTITAVNAANEAVWSADQNDSTTGSRLLQGGELIGADTNVTVRLNADMNPGTTFDFHVVDGSIANSGAYLLCNGDEPVGKYVNLVEQNAAGRATVIGLEFSTDANTSLTKAGALLHLIDSSNDNNCSATNNKLNIIPDLGKCPSVFSDNGLNNNGSRTVTEINSGTPVKVLDYRADIMVACDTPVCTINSSATAFTSSVSSSGINRRVASTTPTDANATDLSCYTIGCSKTIDTSACTTIVTIKNNTDSNISGAELSLTGTIPSGMIATFKSLDINNTEQNVTLNGSAISIKAIEVLQNEEANISVSFIPNGTDTITPSLIGGTLKLTDVNITALKNLNLPLTNGIANFSTGATTDFTVTYMNPSFKSFAMITAKADSKLSATITDTTGKTAEATFDDIPAGKTVFVWADKAGHATSPLQVAADAAGLNGAWRVDFHVTSAVDVAAYMEANGGQRTLTVLYPEYTN